MLEVDQLVDVVDTLTAGDMPLSQVSTKKARDDDQQFPQEDCSPKQTRVAMDEAPEEITQFRRIPIVFSSRLTHTLEEASSNVSTLDLSFVKNFYETNKIKLISEITHGMYQVTSLFSLIPGGVYPEKW